MLIRTLLAAAFIFIGFFSVFVVWYYISAIRDTVGKLTKEEKKNIGESLYLENYDS